MKIMVSRAGLEPATLCLKDHFGKTVSFAFATLMLESGFYAISYILWYS
jgi:hypothetical protein